MLAERLEILSIPLTYPPPLLPDGKRAEPQPGVESVERLAGAVGLSANVAQYRPAGYAKRR